MLGIVAFGTVAAVIIAATVVLVRQSRNERPGRHRAGVPAYAAQHRWTRDSCWKPVCGCTLDHKLPPQAIIERLRREEARAGARYGIGGVRLATAL